ncbi:MAG TPA: hypothetical protein VMC80_01215, partial [Patescibacteria group bacterium]|nr:hypothetical protein [Patescibacteria group bacterium]
MEGKKFILSIFFLFVLLLIISFSSAAINVTKPISNSNWSGSAMFNVTYVNGTDFTDAKNASFYYNASGVWTLLGNVSCNVSGGGTLGYCNGTLSFPNLEGVFSINATLFNLSTQSNLSATVLTNSVILDSKAPAVGPFYNTVAGGNYSGVVVLNVSVSDGRAVDAVYFNITNSSGVQVNYNKSSGSGGYYNFTFNS